MKFYKLHAFNDRNIHYHYLSCEKRPRKAGAQRKLFLARLGFFSVLLYHFSIFSRFHIGRRRPFLAAGYKMHRDLSQNYWSSDIEIKKCFSYISNGHRSPERKKNAAAIFEVWHWRLILLDRLWSKMLLALNAQFNINYRWHQRRSRPLAMLKWQSNRRPAHIIYVHLAVCVAADGLVHHIWISIRKQVAELSL